jgi:hypothetical protein
MGIKSLLLLYLIGQAVCLRAMHLSTGSTAMTSTETSSLIAFIVIGVVACIIVSILVYCLFRDRYHHDAYVTGGEAYYTPQGGQYPLSNLGMFNPRNPCNRTPSTNPDTTTTTTIPITDQDATDPHLHGNLPYHTLNYNTMFKLIALGLLAGVAAALRPQQHIIEANGGLIGIFFILAVVGGIGYCYFRCCRGRTPTFAAMRDRHQWGRDSSHSSHSSHSHE